MSATRIDSATNGLSVTVGDDGAWVEFTTQTGKHFCFQPAQEFCGDGGIGADVVRDWCLEMQARRTAPEPEDSTLDTTQSHPPVVRRFTNHIIGCPSCGNPVDELRDDPKGDFVLASHYDALLAALREIGFTSWRTAEEIRAFARAALTKATGAA